MASIYLDNNATTPLDPLARDAMISQYRETPGNPASQHQAGQAARRVIEVARENIASTLGADSKTRSCRLVFTSGATESNNLAILGLAGTQPGKLVISAIEHPSVLGPTELLRARGWTIEAIEVDADGVINLEHAADLITEETLLVSVMLGNHETGVLQPLPALHTICQDRGVLLHTDATQAVGKIGVSFQELGVDALSFSAHKFHGPIGIGGLLIRENIGLQPIFHGGYQQTGLRPGSESSALIHGMWVALQTWIQQATTHEDRLVRLRDYFEETLQRLLPGVVVIGQQADRLPQTCCVAFPGLDRQALMMALDQAGLACSTGSACASGSSDPSPVLQAMSLVQPVIEGALRFSFSRLNNNQDADQALHLITTVVDRLRGPVSTEKRGFQGPHHTPKPI